MVLGIMPSKVKDTSISPRPMRMRPIRQPAVLTVLAPANCQAAFSLEAGFNFSGRRRPSLGYQTNHESRDRCSPCKHVRSE